LTLADYNTIRYYYRTDSAYNADHNASGNVIDSRVTVGPALEYQMFDTVGVSLSYNMDFAHTHTNNTIAETEHYRGQTYGAYFEAGGSIDFTKAINLNPYVDMYTHTMNVEAFQLGANLNFTIL
jgi:broad specificity polyphosphatase/5'/3'-nucleotidase SurE